LANDSPSEGLFLLLAGNAWTMLDSRPSISPWTTEFKHLHHLRPNTKDVGSLVAWVLLHLGGRAYFTCAITFTGSNSSGGATSLTVVVGLEEVTPQGAEMRLWLVLLLGGMDDLEREELNARTFRGVASSVVAVADTVQAKASQRC
jgi:hypothetical protein